jgi:hypothetical protein
MIRPKLLCRSEDIGRYVRVAHVGELSVWEEVGNDYRVQQTFRSITGADRVFQSGHYSSISTS